MISCDNEDFTGYSTIVPTSPTITVTGIPASVNFVEMDSTFTFNVTLSEAQVVDIVLKAKQIAGTATEGEDYKILNDAGKLTILAGATTGQFKIKILADDLKEKTETATVQIGDETTSNATLTPVNFVFTIQNLLTDELSVDMSWDTDVLAAVGVDLTPVEVADMRLLIVDSNGDIVDGADGATFETWAGFNALPDGVYRIATDIYATMNFGDINEVVNLSMTLAFNQPGAINDTTLDFPNLMTNEYVCESYRVYMAIVTKAGTAYTITKSVEVPSNILQGTWFGTDTDPALPYDSEVEVLQACDLLISGLGFGWMGDFWGETIVDGGSVILNVDEATKTVTIDTQYYVTTVYKNVVQTPYDIVGTGTYDDSGEFTTMNITYEFVQGGWSPSGWCFDNGYMNNKEFTAVLTLDPAGLPAPGKGQSTKIKLSNKPTR